jgi:hypothetical protein
MQAGTLAIGPVTADSAAQRAHRWLVRTFGLVVGGMIIGREWDRAWHATHPFENFYSPPHLFIYSMATATTLLAAALALIPALRAPFGSPMRVWGVPFPVPAPVVLWLGGFALLGLAGLLDDLWHSTCGLDETGWSTPHAMIGWALLTITWGFVACRLALRPARPLPRYTAVGLAFIVLACSATPFLGPLSANNSPAVVEAVRRIPTLAAQPPFEHTARIYLAWDLTRTNWLLLPLGALWAGAALALLRALDPRLWVSLAALTIWTVLELILQRGQARTLDQFYPVLADRAAWLPLPILPAALAVFGLRRLRLPAGICWAVGGLTWGLCVLAVWGPQSPLLALAGLVLAVLLVPAGAALGVRIAGVLLHPSGRTVPWLVLFALTIPLLTGLVDLYLRLHTP